MTPLISFLFQFHNGSIKGFSGNRPMNRYLCFNSTMVRLKVTEAAKYGYIESVFQFHNGSIKGTR